jgi:hypothetical protein
MSEFLHPLLHTLASAHALSQRLALVSPHRTYIDRQARMLGAHKMRYRKLYRFF